MNRRGVFTKLNLHFVILGALVVLDIFLGVRIALAWSAIRSNQSGEFAQEEIRHEQLKTQMQHLNGLPEKVQVADADAHKFFDRRIAPNYSTLFAALGDAAAKSHVTLSRTEYAQQPAIDHLTEVHIDAGLSGEYTALMQFINDMERDRDHVFFIIDGLAFTGQQGGLVNLRLRLTTYIQSGATDMPPGTQSAGQTPAAQPAAAEGAR